MLVLFAPLHAKDVAKITPADIADVLRMLKPETASRAYTAIRAVFDYAEVVLLPYGVMISNPANTRSLAALGWKRKSRKTHVQQPAVHYEHVPEVVSELRALDCDDVRCLLLIIATGLRCGTVRAAKWADIDFTERLWRVPPADLKTGKDRDEPFRVPLNNLAVDVLKRCAIGHRLASSSPIRQVGRSEMALLLTFCADCAEDTINGATRTRKSRSAPMVFARA